MTALRLRTQIIDVDAQGPLHVFQGRTPRAAAAVHFGQRMISGRLPGVIPRRLVKRGVTFAEKRFFANFLELGTALDVQPIAQAKAQVVVRFSVIRVWVAQRESLDRRTKAAFGLGEFSAAEMPEPQGVVAARIAGIAAQCLAPIERRAARRMTILRQMQTGEVKFVALVISSGGSGSVAGGGTSLGTGACGQYLMISPP